MQLELKNPNNIIQNAFFNSTDLAFNLFINTVEKWIDYDSLYTNSDTLILRYGTDEVTDTLILYSESLLDEAIFKRMRFEQPNKDQLWIIFIQESVYLHQQTPADHRTYPTISA